MLDTVLIAVIFAIIVAIGYILSRPFMHAETMHEASSVSGEYLSRYRMLLSEIKNLEDECESAEIPDLICEQLEDKKQLAAHLLRKISPSVTDDRTPSLNEPALSQIGTQQERDLPLEISAYCTQCGSQVFRSDKFCTHCGRSLHP